MALVIPIEGIEFNVGRGPVGMLIILTEENIARMKEGDPFDMQLREIPTLDHSKRLRDLDVIIAVEEEETVKRLMNEGGIVALLAHIERKRIHAPGDAQPPKSIKPTKLRLQ
jgi:hypothetical protein